LDREEVKNYLISQLKTDNQPEDYHLLFEAAKAIANVSGLSIEIGTREGGSSKWIIDGLLSHQKAIRTHIMVDPYGEIPYVTLDVQETNQNYVIHGRYGNDLRNIAIPGIFALCEGTWVDPLFFQMTDEQFFKRYADGVPVYIDRKEWIINQYALVFLDGPHSLLNVTNEMFFFEPRCDHGSIMVFDDVDLYSHDKIHQYLISKKWKPLHKNERKLSYQKQ
jgi:hypothetical protein